jgi:hypothetical protein
MSTPKPGEEVYLDAQTSIYKRLGQALFDLLGTEQQDAWRFVKLEVHQLPVAGGQDQSYRVTLILSDGLELPLVARAEVIDLCRRLDLLARNRFGGSSWTAFT